VAQVLSGLILNNYLPPATVGIGPIPTGFAITVDLAITIPGMAKADAQKIVDAAHIVCPYSNATRGNVAVTLSVV
jgi:lipoyl-dependent peroxiredoxin